MKSAKPIAVALTLLLTGVFASTAGARTLHASGGGVSAKLTFNVNRKTHTISTPQLALTQSGAAGYSAPVQERKCGSGYCSEPTLNVANLDGAHDAVVSLFTGGAHCCTLARVYAQSSSGRWHHVDHDFADPSFRLEDLGHDGQQEFVTANDAFAYLLTDYADSGMPIDVLSFEHGKFVDVTRQYPSLVRLDATRWWKLYRGVGNGAQIGIIAPWAADEDNLGNQSTVATKLAAQVTKGRLTAKQVRTLQHYLKKFGYTQ